MADDVSRRYRGRTVFGPFVAVRDSELDALEYEVGCRLPNSYREFITLANGGTLEYGVRVPPDGNGEVVSFEDLYRVGGDDSGEYGPGTLIGEYRRRHDWWLAEHVAMEHLLPIARGGGGDTLFLDLDPESFGRLHALVYGLPEWTGLRQDTVMVVVAETFDDYLDSLFIDDDLAETNWEAVQTSDVGDPRRNAVRRWLDEGLPGWRARHWASSTSHDNPSASAGMNDR